MKTQLTLSFIILFNFLFGQDFDLNTVKSLDDKSCVEIIQNEFALFEDLNDTLTLNWINTETSYSNKFLENSISGWKSLSSKMRDLASRKSERTYSTNISEKGEYFFLKQRNSTKELFYKKSYLGEDEKLFSPKEFKPETNELYSIEYIKPSWNGEFVAIALSSEGKEFSEIVVFDVESKKILPEIIPNCIPASFFGVDWLPDNSGFIYLKFNKDNNVDPFVNTSSIYYKIGDDPAKSKVIFSANNNPNLNLDPAFFPKVEILARDSKYMIAHIANVSNYWDAYYAKIEDIHKSDAIVWTKLHAKEDKVYQRNQVFYNGKYVYKTAVNAKNFKISSSNVTKKGISKISETIIEEKPNEVIEDFISLPKGILYTTLENAVKARLYFKANNGVDKEIKLPRASGSIRISSEGSGKNKIWVTISGWLNNGKRFEYDLRTNKFIEKPLYVASEYPEFKDFINEEITVTSHDGQEIPLTLIYDKDCVKDGSSPVLIQGYGAYGDILDPYFSTRYLSWVAEGGIFAVAHVRGGGAKGEQWHKAGYKLTKANTWKDAISCAEYLIKEGYTSKGKISILGSSAGGIMVGRAIIERPELFSSAIIRSGLLNPFRYETVNAGGTNTGEFGSVKNPEECVSLMNMDALINIKEKKNYPAVLAIVGLNDIRVPPWMSIKFMSKLKEYNTSNRPLLFKAASDAGHFGSGSEDTHDKWGKIFAFALSQAGHSNYKLKD